MKTAGPLRAPRSTHVYNGLTVWWGRLDTVFDDDSSLLVLYVLSCLGLGF